MKITLVVVGKLKDRGVREACEDYAKRIRRYAQLEEIELKDEREDLLIARMEKVIPARSHVVALEVLGKSLTSDQWAQHVQRVAEDLGHLTLLIGGSYGLPKAISARADLQLTLSRMTLPHRLARLVLMEQVYRAFTILRGEPYSH